MAVSGNTLTVTFGTQNGPTRSASGGDTMVWTPSSSARDRAQNPANTPQRPRAARATKSSRHPFARATDDQQHCARPRRALPLRAKSSALAVVRRQLRDGRQAYSDARFARAKEASAQDRSALVEVVQPRRLECTCRGRLPSRDRGSRCPSRPARRSGSHSTFSTERFGVSIAPLEGELELSARRSPGAKLMPRAPLRLPASAPPE